MNETKYDNLPFDAAFYLLRMKVKTKIARKTWDNRAAYISAQTPDENSKMSRPYLYINILGEKLARVPWLPCQSDLFSSDWYALD